MRGVSIRRARMMLLCFCLVMFFQPTAIAEDYLYFEPLTEESTRWNLYLFNQQVGPTHIYGNFTYGVTFDEAPLYVLFFVNNDDNSTTLHNATSEPFEFNFNTLDYSVGEHELTRLEKQTVGGALVGGGMTLFFEHEDKSFDQILYNGVSIAIIAASIVAIFGIPFIYKRRSKSRIS